MIVSIHQPAYLPWLGYLERIAMSDVFVYLDTVQFEKNSFTNRNRIKTANGTTMLTVPVKKHGHTSSTLLELKVDETLDWRKKHLRSIDMSYRKSNRFAEKISSFGSLLEKKTDNFSDMVFEQLRFWLTEFEIGTKVVRASEINVAGKKAELVTNICQFLGASKYISGPLGRDYLQSESFSLIDVELVFHDFIHPTYQQLYGEFVAGMGAVDYWMNDGSPEIFRRNRSFE